MFDDLILDNFASTSIQSGYNHLELIQHVAGACWKPIPVESVSPILGNAVRSPRGSVVVTFPGNLFDQVAYQYESVWWLSARGLNLQPIEKITGDLSSFDLFVGQFVGGRMSRTHRSSRRFLNEMLPDLIVALDGKDFQLRDSLEKAAGRRLADWNQKHPREAIYSFANSFNAGLPWLHRGIKRRIYRAVEKYDAAQ
jgi:hypothetical protein